MRTALDGIGNRKSRQPRRLGRGALASLLGIALLLFVLAGCGGDDDGADVEETSDTEAANGDRVQLEDRTIGILGPVDSAEIIKMGTDATQLAAETLGWDTIRLDPGGDPAEMATSMTNLVNAGVDGIVLTTMEPATIQAGLRAADEQGLPVINTQALTTESPLIDGFYWPSPQEENDLLIDRMSQDLSEGSTIGEIALTQYRNAEIASEMFTESAEERGWEIVATHDSDVANLVPDVNAAVGDMLRANPDLDAFWGAGDFAPPGAVPAIREAGADVSVYSVHGVPSAIRFAADGSAILQIANHQKSNFIAIDQLAAHWANDEEISQYTPDEFTYEMTIVDEGNAGEGYPYPIEDVLAQFEDRWSEEYIPAD